LQFAIPKFPAIPSTVETNTSILHARLRSRRSILQALLDTQQDHTARLTRIDDRLGNIEDRLGNVADRLGNVADRLGYSAGGVETIHGKLDRLLERE
jgi:hypothetical protein